MSKLLKAVNDQAKDISNMDLLNQLSSILDKHREVSIQEAIYRMLSLNMTYSSIVVKHLTTVHPHYRDGLLKGNLEKLSENESIFHMSPHQYYENRELKCLEGIPYRDDEKKDGYWTQLSLSEFRSSYDLVYGGNKRDKTGKLKYIPLCNTNVCIKRRSETCILKYYLNYSNDEDLARALLILFHPFTDEMKDIHQKDVMELYSANKNKIQKKRNKFEKHKIITDMINLIQKENEKHETEEFLEDDFEDIETTTSEEFESFEKWAKSQAKSALRRHEDLTHLVKLDKLRDIIMDLNEQQRRIFDDFCERIITEDEVSFCLYIGGEAGTGKSHLLRLMIEIVKHLSLKSGDELNKPSAIVMAPTANASYIIKGKTIESALGMLPRSRNTFVKVKNNRLSNLTFLYENVAVAFCDEISMVGSCKFTKMHFQLQDIVGDNNFMGGLNFVAVGDFRQLPPVLDGYVYETNHLDGRPALAPSHWDENFRIFYLTEKMRSQKDPEFSFICDRVGNGSFNKDDLLYLENCVRNTDSENNNENFKDGKISIIVTTNKRRQEINENKLETLIKNEKTHGIIAMDRCTNLENPPEVPSNLSITQTGGLEKSLTIRKNAPIVITSNHHISKYKEDGIVNGARGYIDSIQVSKENNNEVEVIWVVFKDKQVGRLLKYDFLHLNKLHKPNDKEAVPILKQKKNFTINKGEVRFQRTQFPLTLAYAITAYKCQGDTLEEVIIDFSHEPGEKTNIQWGSFYVALTRVKEGKHVFLRSFDKSHITFNEKVERKIAAMREYKAYIFKKIYVEDAIFKHDAQEVKLGYFNMRGFLESNHAQYLDKDRNLLKLQLLVISETWLDSSTSNKSVTDKLKNWKIIKRLDATDNKKHMGLMLIAPINFENYNALIFSLDYVQDQRNNGELLYQGLILDLKQIYKKIVCLYIRKTPSEKESSDIGKRFQHADCIIGDLNLNPAIPKQKSNLLKICGSIKSIALTENTTMNNNQLDHVLLDNNMNNCFSTSYLNLASDHRPIVVRIPLPGNQFSETFLEHLNFDSDHHLKMKMKQENTWNNQEDMSSEYKGRNSKVNGKFKSKKEQKVFGESNIENEVNVNNQHTIIRFMNPPGTNMCFANAAASCLLNIPELLSIFKETRCINPNSVLGELSRLSKMTNYSVATTERLRCIVETKCFENRQWSKNFNNQRQHDSAEFLQSSLEHLWADPSTPGALKEEVFGGLSQNSLVCECEHEEELQVQHMPEVIPIQIKGDSIQSCLNDYFAPEHVEWNCPSCKRSPVLRKSKIIAEPNTLILQLMRYKYDEIGQNVMKLSGEVNCPANLVIPNGLSYTLISVINHIGENTKSGHYHMVLHDQNCGQFTLIDDCAVSKVEDFNQEMNKLSYIFIFRKNYQ